MYTYNKNDKSYTFSSDELDIESLIENSSSEKEEEKENNPTVEKKNSENTIPVEEDNSHEPPPKIEIINGGNDLNISPVSDYLEIEKPKMEKKENIIIPENKN